jgi:hypothetical protein
MLRCRKNLRSYSEQALDVTGKVALIGEANLMCNFANRVPVGREELSCFSGPRFNDVLVWRLTCRLFEQKREVVGTHVHLACNRGDR